MSYLNNKDISGVGNTFSDFNDQSGYVNIPSNSLIFNFNGTEVNRINSYGLTLPGEQGGIYQKYNSNIYSLLKSSDYVTGRKNLGVGLRANEALFALSAYSNNIGIGHQTNLNLQGNNNLVIGNDTASVASSHNDSILLGHNIAAAGLTVCLSSIVFGSNTLQNDSTIQKKFVVDIYDRGVDGSISSSLIHSTFNSTTSAQIFRTNAGQFVLFAKTGLPYIRLQNNSTGQATSDGSYISLDSNNNLIIEQQEPNTALYIKNNGNYIQGFTSAIASFYTPISASGISATSAYIPGALTAGSVLTTTVTTNSVNTGSLNGTSVTTTNSVTSPTVSATQISAGTIYNTTLNNSVTNSTTSVTSPVVSATQISAGTIYNTTANITNVNATNITATNIVGSVSLTGASALSATNISAINFYSPSFTASQMLVTDTNKKLISYPVSNLLGTSNQITVANGTGTIVGGSNVTLSLPQDITSASNVRFAKLGLGITPATSSAPLESLNNGIALVLRSASTNESYLTFDPSLGLISTGKNGSGTLKPLLLGVNDSAKISINNTGTLLQVSGTSYFTGTAGFGTTPYSWDSTFKAIDISTTSSLLGSNDSLYLTNNAYYSGGFLYKTASYSTTYAQNNLGEHLWYTAASGSVNGGITYGNPKLTLKQNGDLLIGTITNSPINSNVATVTIGGTHSGISGGLAYQINGTPAAYQYVDSDSLFSHQAQSGYGQKWLTSGVERMRLNSAGNLGLGTTVITDKFALNGTIEFNDGSNARVAQIDYSSSSGDGTLIFKTRNSGSASERVRINNLGELMIGTTNATGNKLNVSGAANITGNLSIGTTSNSYTLDVRNATVAQIVASQNSLVQSVLGSDSSTGAYVGTLTNDNFKLIANSSIKATLIASTGELLIGTSTPTGSGTLLTINGALKSTIGTFTTSYSTQTYTANQSASSQPDGAVTLFQNSGALDDSFGGITLYARNTNTNNQGVYIGAVSSPFATSQFSPYLVFGRRTGSSTFAEMARFTTTSDFLIGTVTPYTGGKFVIGNGNSVVYRTDNYAQQIIDTNYTSGISLVILRHSRTGGTNLQNGDYVGAIQSNSPSNGSYNNLANMISYIDGSYSASNTAPSGWIWGTTIEGSAVPVERMRLNSLGRLLINTSADNGSTLLVNGTTSAISYYGTSAYYSSLSATTITTPQFSTTNAVITNISATSLTFPSFTGNQLAAFDTDKKLISYAPLSNLLGTANQITVSNGTGVLVSNGNNVTLTLPQDIATTSTPTFKGINVSRTDGYATVLVDTSATNSTSLLVLRSTRTGGTNLSSGDYVGAVQANSFFNNSSKNLSNMICYIDGTYNAANTAPSGWIWGTTIEGSSVPVERMRLNSLGRLLINTSADNGSTLLVNGTTSAVSYYGTSAFIINTSANTSIIGNDSGESYNNSVYAMGWASSPYNISEARFRVKGMYHQNYDSIIPNFAVSGDSVFNGKITAFPTPLGTSYPDYNYNGQHIDMFAAGTPGWGHSNFIQSFTSGTTFINSTTTSGYGVGSKLALNTISNGDIVFGALGSNATIYQNAKTIMQSVSAQSLTFPSFTGNRIAAFDSNKSISALDTGTYPSLTELSYVKGASSNLQTQISGLVPYTGANSNVHLGSNNLIIGATTPFSMPSTEKGIYLGYNTAFPFPITQNTTTGHATIGNTQWDMNLKSYFGYISNRLTYLKYGVDDTTWGELNPQNGMISIYGGMDNDGFHYGDFTANTILHADSNKLIKSLDTATYPSLPELAYVKGLNQNLSTSANVSFANLTVSGTTTTNTVSSTTISGVSISYGKSYTPTSTATNTNIVDTGITKNSYHGFDGSSMYEIFVTCNIDKGLSTSTKCVIMGYISISTGYNGGTPLARISYNEIINDAGIGASTKPNINVYFWDGATQTDQIAYTDTTSQIRIVIDNYNGTVDSNQDIKIIKKI